MNIIQGDLKDILMTISDNNFFFFLVFLLINYETPLKMLLWGFQGA